MGIIFTRFFLACGLIEIAVAVAMHCGVRMHPKLNKHSAFGQMCLGAGCMFLAQAFSALQSNPATWVAVGLAPVLFVLGWRLEVQARRAIAPRRRHARHSIQPSGGPA